MALNERCDYCGRSDGPISHWLPEKHRADRFSPNGFSGDELIGTCQRCTAKYQMSHDPDKPRKTPRKPWFLLHENK